MSQKVEFELVAKTGDTVKQVEKVDKAIKKTRTSAVKSKMELSGFAQAGKAGLGQLDRLTGGLASKLVNVGKAAKLSGKAMKTALISSGIGAAVVAIGLIVEYWDKITKLIDGVTSEQEAMLDATQKTLESQQEQLNVTGQMENTLKLQGKSEKEIRDLKIQQTDEIIASTELLLQQQKEQKKAQVEAAERNQNITKGIIAFLSLPLTILLGLIDGITNSLANLGIIDEGTTLTEDYLDFTSSFIFDPEAVEKAGDETITKTEEALRKLRNTRDGYDLEDKKKNEEAIAKKNDDEIKAEKRKAEALERIRKGLIDTEAEERAEKLRLIKEDYDEQIKLAEEFYGKDSEKVKELRQAKKNAVDEQQAVFDEQDKARAEKLAADEKQRLQDIADAEEEAKKYKEEQYREGYNNLQNIVSVGGKKMEAVSKALAIADVARSSFKSISETVSNTGIANAKAVAASPTTAGQPFVATNTIKAALSIGSTLASAKKSISAITANSKSPSGAKPSGGGGGGGAPQPPAFNVVGASGTNQLADAINGQNERPTRAYVVSEDVTSAQQLDRNIIEGASI